MGIDLDVDVDKYIQILLFVWIGGPLDGAIGLLARGLGLI